MVFEFGSEYDWESNRKYLLKDKIKDKIKDKRKNLYLLRSGRDALGLLADAEKRKCNTVLLPFLCCESMEMPFRRAGYKIIYYKLQQDFKADYADVKRKLTNGCILLYMNYFGNLSFTTNQLEDIREEGKYIILAEDITHDFLYRYIEGDFGTADYTVCSIRKWFAVPDGGILISKTSVLQEWEEDETFAKLREEALKIKSQYLRTANPTFKIEFRKKLADANLYLENDHKIVGMSEMSKEIWEYLDIEKIYKKRCENVEICQKEFGQVMEIGNDNLRSTLYFPLLIGKKQLEIENMLAAQGIYMPVIWPLPKGAKKGCAVSELIAEQMLAFPCDHRYGKEEIQYSIKVLKGVLQDEKVNDIRS